MSICSRASRLARIIACLAFGLVPAGVACAQADEDGGPGSRPLSAGRIAASFAFEERLTNPLPIPLNWLRAQHDPEVRERPGFPIWNETSLDYLAPAHSGEGTVRVPVSGGSASLRLNPGVLPIFADGEYMVTGWVRTERCVHSRARLVVRVLDAQSNVIDLPMLSSRLVRTAGEWQQIAVRLPSKITGSAFLQIDLELVQPEAFIGTSEQSELRVMAQDFDAVAWFDDIEVVQLPRIELSTGQPGHLFVGPRSPQISVLVQDLTAEQLSADLWLYDAQGNVIATDSYPVHGGRDPRTWKPAIERYGWYRVGLEVRTPMGRVGSSYLDFAYLPPHPETDDRGPASASVTLTDRRRFALLLDELPDELAQELNGGLAAAVHATGATSVSLPMWTEQGRLEDLPAWLDRLAELIDELRRSWVDVSLSFARLPPGLAAGLQLDRNAVVAGIGSGDERLESYLLDGLDRFGQRIDRWRLSRPGDYQPGTDAELADRLTMARDMIRSLAPGPQTAVGWRADQSPPEWAERDLMQRFEVLAPVGMSPRSFGELIGAWGGVERPSGPAITMVIEQGETNTIGAQAVADNVLERGIEAWAVLGEDSDAVALLSPWRERNDGVLTPSPALAAWRTLTDQLSGRRITGQWDIGPGVRCLILSPADPESGRTGALALWADGPDGAGQSLRALLAAGEVVIVDTFGNRTSVAPEPGSEPHYVQHVVPITGSPVFIEGVDADLVTLQSSIRLNPPMIQSTPGLHRHAIELYNPSEYELLGHAIVISPGGIRPGQTLADRQWFVSPRTQPLRARGEQWTELPIELSFVPGVEAGPMEMVIDLLLESTAEPMWVRTRTPIELGLDRFDIELTLRISPDGSDAVVEVTMTNTSDEELRLEATAFARGYPRQRLSGVILQPGQSLTRFTPPFAGAGQNLAGQGIGVAVVDRETRARLNKSVRVP